MGFASSVLACAERTEATFPSSMRPLAAAADWATPVISARDGNPGRSQGRERASGSGRSSFKRALPPSSGPLGERRDLERVGASSGSSGPAWRRVPSLMLRGCLIDPTEEAVSLSLACARGESYGRATRGDRCTVEESSLDTGGRAGSVSGYEMRMAGCLSQSQEGRPFCCQRERKSRQREASN